MNRIGDLLTRDLSRRIEEITQVDQVDEESVYSEITEYIATDSIRDHYATLLKAVAEGTVYYDPGIKLEAASSSAPTHKLRSQIRINSAGLPVLYRTTRVVRVDGSEE